MSLLLDALKRAEQEKLARQAQEPHAASGAAPEPAAPAPPPTPAAAEAGEAAARRNLELEPHEPAPPGVGAGAADPGKREGAKAMFAAKQPEAAATAGSGRKTAILAFGIGALVLLAAGGAYVWYELNKVAGPVARGPVPSAPKPISPAAPQAAAPEAGAPQAVTAAPAPPAPPAPKRTDAVPPVASLKAGEPAAAAPRARPQPKAAEELVMSLLKESGESPRAAPPLKLSRTIDAPRVSPDVARGYEALRRGDAPEARKAYEAALAADPASLDAHLGLATAAARSGDRDTATRHYRRALSLDPKNPSAVAGLAALADLSRPEGLEEQLRADITRYPQSPALHFTLGNLYASQSRWTEAQAAYFEAYRLDPDSADLAYNLAVSLDHLGQAKLAADFYQRALAAARRQAAQFDRGQVARRIAELRP